MCLLSIELFTTTNTRIIAMNAKLQELKDLVKNQACKIKKTRQEVKERQRGRKYAGNGQAQLQLLRWENRHHHIAYSELRGKERVDIETPRDDNLPDENYIRSIKEAYEQVVCDCAA
jgi:Tfp pilus assembly protein PilN